MRRVYGNTDFVLSLAAPRTGPFRPSNPCTLAGDVFVLIASGSNGGGRVKVGGNIIENGDGTIEQ